jgi:hypothetical protein
MRLLNQTLCLRSVGAATRATSNARRYFLVTISSVTYLRYAKNAGPWRRTILKMIILILEHCHYLNVCSGSEVEPH